MTNILYFYNTIRDDDSVSSTTTEEESPGTSRRHTHYQGVVVSSSESGLMEISLLEALLNTFSRFNHLFLCVNMKIEPVWKFYKKIDLILSYFSLVLNALVNSQIASNEQLNKVFEELDKLVNEASELVESWHPTTSIFYFVMQADSLNSRIQSSCLDALKLLNSMHQDLCDPLNATSVEVMQAESSISRIQSSCLDALKLLNSMHQDLPDPLNLTSVEAGVVRYLVKLMDPAAGMVDNAVAILANLATFYEGRSAIGQAGGIPVLVEVVELGSAREKENAAAALLQLCVNRNKFCYMVLREGAVPPLVALSQSGTPRAKEEAQALLSYFRSLRHGNAGRG